MAKLKKNISKWQNFEKKNFEMKFEKFSFLNSQIKKSLVQKV